MFVQKSGINYCCVDCIAYVRMYSYMILRVVTRPIHEMTTHTLWKRGSVFFVDANVWKKGPLLCLRQNRRRWEWVYNTVSYTHEGHLHTTLWIYFILYLKIFLLNPSFVDPLLADEGNSQRLFQVIVRQHHQRLHTRTHMHTHKRHVTHSNCTVYSLGIIRPAHTHETTNRILYRNNRTLIHGCLFLAHRAAAFFHSRGVTHTHTRTTITVISMCRFWLTGQQQQQPFFYSLGVRRLTPRSVLCFILSTSTVIKSPAFQF